jgi:hypothetical protein
MKNGSRVWRNLYGLCAKKGPKKKESLLKLSQLWKSTKVAFGDSLDDFHKPLEKASAQNASAFSQFQQARLNTNHLPPPLAEGN